MKDENAEKIGTLADELDAVLFTSKLPLPPQLHLSSLQEKVREARDILAAVFKDETGDDPWEDNPLVG
ncbi:hypothetical protein [Sinorhizobium meliloti]|uniref:hypothetical protein n=1 Tax=Rhizobium meliloti TaxID=382 RepID=UPI000FD7A91B|nr:hypothetical protein [Sinorhizobium meliloti]RVH21453.1 hypothetical protein CN216_00330 [Sinorhizobium meliloti]RVH21514.1 hypothetical protein CN216_00650 [Sinorhizobium meliloti]